MRRQVSVSPKLLLAIYGLLPIGLLLVVVDRVFAGGEMFSAIAKDPNDYVWFTLLFTLPHIMTSFFGFLDREYIQFYGQRVLRGAQYMVIAIFVLSLLGTDAIFLGLGLYTMTHVFLQQSGIAKSLMKGSNKQHFYWQWLGVALSFVLYTTVYSTLNIDAGLLLYGLVFACFIFIVLGVFAVRASKTKIGRYYFWATALIPIVSMAFYYLDYQILLIAVPRIIHDLTAFVFYCAHDHNRYASSPTNYLYRIAAKISLPVMVASPVLGVLFAYPLQFGNSSDLFLLVVFISLMHYWVEGFMWRKGSLHRKYIQF